MAGSQPLTEAAAGPARGRGGPLPGGVAGTGGMRRDGGSPRAGGRDVTVRPVVTVIGGDRRHESFRVGGRRGIMCALRDSGSLARSLSGSLSGSLPHGQGDSDPDSDRATSGRRGKSLNTASAASLRVSEVNEPRS